MTTLKTTLLHTVSIASICLVSMPVFAVEADIAADVEIITVVGDRIDRSKVTGSATAISEVQLERFKFDDINRILRFVPGVNLQEEDGFGLRPNIGLRGSGVERSAKITLMEDGVLIAPAPYAAPSAYYFPVAARMTGVEVRKGSAAIAYGPRTVGGAINLISRAIPDDIAGFVDVRFGGNGHRTLHTSFGGQSGDFGANIEYYGTRNDGFKFMANGGDTGFSVDDFLFKGNYIINDGGNLDQVVSVKIGKTRQDSNETYLGLTQEHFDAVPNFRYAASQKDRMDSNHDQYQITYKVSGENFTIATTAYQNEFTRDWFKLDDFYVDGVKTKPGSVLDNPADYIQALGILRGNRDSEIGALRVKHNARSYRSRGIQTNIAYDFSMAETSHKIEFSARYHEDYEDRLQYRENYTMTDGVMVFDSAAIPGSAGNRIASADAWAFYLQDTIQWGKWTFVPGVRVEYIDLMREDYGSSDPARNGGVTGSKFNNVNTFTPGLGFSYKVDDQLTVTGGLFEGFNPPGTGDTNAKEEKSTSFELGFAYARDNYFVEVMSFYSDYSNILGTCTAASGCAVGEIGDQYNGGAADIYGLEITANTDVQLNEDWSVNLTAVYTYTQATFDTAFSDGFWGDVVSGDHMPYVPAHQFNLRSNITDGKVDLSATFSYVSAARATAGQGVIAVDQLIEAHTVVDVALTYPITEDIKVFASVDNLFKETYTAARRPYGLRPGKPRTWQMGVKYTF